MTTSTRKSTDAAIAASALTETARLKEIASRHGLSGDGLVQLVAEARSEARDRRRRLPIPRLEEIVRELGAKP